VRTDEFWAIVEAARAEVDDPTDDVSEIAEALIDRLATLPPDQIIEFELAFDAVTAEGYRWDLWAAAYLINGGCSDDCFDYFRGWLIAQGRAVWEAALANPDSLAEFVDAEDQGDTFDGEDVLGAASEAYEQVTGDEEGFWDALERAQEAAPDAEETGAEPAGEEFDFDDEDQMRARLPHLAAIFLDEDD
jgi:Protein of unknown function (DUF4240)